MSKKKKLKIKTRGARATYNALELCLSYARDLMIPDRNHVLFLQRARKTPNNSVTEQIKQETSLPSPFSLNSVFDWLPFAWRVPVHEKKSAYFQHSRLSQLRKLGAEVFLCEGKTPDGCWHVKAAVLNRRTLYSGGSNFTKSGREKNSELV